MALGGVQSTQHFSLLESTVHLLTIFASGAAPHGGSVWQSTHLDPGRVHLRLSLTEYESTPLRVWQSTGVHLSPGPAEFGRVREYTPLLV